MSQPIIIQDSKGQRVQVVVGQDGLLRLAISAEIESSTLPVGAATEATLQQVRDRLSDLEAYAAQLQILTTAIENINTQILGSVDGLEALDTQIRDAVDALAPLVNAINTTLTTIESFTDQIEAKQDIANTSLASIDSKIATVTNQISELTKLDTLHADLGIIEGKQDTGNTSLSSIDTKTPALVTGRVPVDGSGVTQPISATSLPLPIGAATNSNQNTSNASLASIDTKLSSQATAANQTSELSKLDILHSDNSAIETKLDTLHADNGTIDSDIKASQPRKMQDGSGTALTSTLVSSKQSLDVNVTQSALPAGASTASNQATANTSLSSIDGKVATSSKQDVGNTSLASIFAGQSDGNQKTKLVNAGGNTAEITASGSLFTNLRNSSGTEIGTVSNPLQTSVTSGSVALSDGEATTYTACAVNLSVASSATDIFTLTGSGTKTIKVTRFGISGTQTTLGDISFLLVKRSTGNSGGTSSVIASVPHDSSDPAASAVVRSYTANPTLGTTVGTIRVAKLFVPTSSSNSTEMFLEFDLSTGFSKPIYVRGANEVLAINLNGVTVAGSSFNIYMEWTEV